jgi:hypothetical protein
LDPLIGPIDPFPGSVDERPHSGLLPCRARCIQSCIHHFVNQILSELLKDGVNAIL